MVDPQEIKWMMTGGFPHDETETSMDGSAAVSNGGFQELGMNQSRGQGFCPVHANDYRQLLVS